MMTYINETNGVPVHPHLYASAGLNELIEFYEANENKYTRGRRGISVKKNAQVIISF